MQPGAGEQHDRQRNLRDDEALRRRRCRTPAPIWRAPSFSDSCMSARAPSNAGARPQMIAVSSETVAVKASTG